MMYNRFSIVEFQSAGEVARKTSKQKESSNMFQFTSMMKMPHFVEVSTRGRKRKHPIDETQAKMTIKSTEIFMSTQPEWVAYQHEHAQSSNNEHLRVASNTTLPPTNTSSSLSSRTCNNNIQSPKKKIKPNLPTSNLTTTCNTIPRCSTTTTSNMSTNKESEMNTQKIANELSLPLSFPTSLGSSNHMHSHMPHISLIGNKISLSENTHLIVALVTNKPTTTTTTPCVSSSNSSITNIPAMETISKQVNGINQTKTPIMESSNTRLLPSSNTTSCINHTIINANTTYASAAKPKIASSFPIQSMNNERKAGRTSISIQELLN